MDRVIVLGEVSMCSINDLPCSSSKVLVFLFVALRKDCNWRSVWKFSIHYFPRRRCSGPHGTPLKTNDQDQPVAAADSPFQSSMNGNSAASFCSFAISSEVLNEFSSV